MKKIEALLEWGGMKRDIVFLAVSAQALVLSLALPQEWLPVDPAWIVRRAYPAGGGGGAYHGL